MSVGMLVRSEAASAGAVRREIASDLAGRGLVADSVEDVVLVASELVGNAVRHGGTGEFTVTWRIHRDSVTVRVSDHSPVHPQPAAGDPTSTQGRGMLIVGALTNGWGVTETGTGKRVWARVPIRRD